MLRPDEAIVLRPDEAIMLRPDEAIVLRVSDALAPADPGTLKAIPLSVK